MSVCLCVAVSVCLSVTTSNQKFLASGCLTKSLPGLQPGQFVGVGIEFEENKAERSIRVSGIMPRSPAAESGQIFCADILLRVDDEETREWTLLTLADTVLGPPETSLKLTFLSPISPNGVKDVVLTRRAPGELPRAARSPRGLEKVSFTA